MPALLEEQSQARQVHPISKNDRERASINTQDAEVRYMVRQLSEPKMVGFHLTVEPDCG